MLLLAYIWFCACRRFFERALGFHPVTDAQRQQQHRKKAECAEVLCKRLRGQYNRGRNAVAIGFAARCTSVRPTALATLSILEITLQKATLIMSPG